MKQLWKESFVKSYRKRRLETGKKTITNEELTEISNKVTKVLVEELSDDGQRVNPAEFVCVLAIMHRTMFAIIEAKDGIEKARELTGFLIDLVETTLEDGVWDEERKCIR